MSSAGSSRFARLLFEKPILTPAFAMLLNLALPASSHSQSTGKFKDIDALLGTGSMIDAFSALNQLNSTYRKDSTDGQYWLRYSQASYTAYKYEDAKRAADKAIILDPKNADYYYEKGRLLNKLGETDSAGRALDKAILLRPEGKYYYWRGIINQQLKNDARAADDYKKAEARGAATAEMYNNLAILLMGRQEISEALIAVNKAIALHPFYAQAYSARSKINLYLGQADSACADKEKASALGYLRYFPIPDSVCGGSFKQKTHYMADLCASTGFFKQAIVMYTRLLDAGELLPDFFLNRGYCFYQLKQYAQAEKDYLRALESPGDGEDLLYDNLSLLYFDQGMYELAVSYAGKRIQLNPKNPVPYIDRGLSYRKMKKYAEAEKDFNKSLALKPDFFRAYGYRAFLYLETGQYQKSLEDATRAVDINPKYGYGYLVLAQAKQKLGERDFCMDLYNARKYGWAEAEEAITQFCK